MFNKLLGWLKPKPLPKPPVPMLTVWDELEARRDAALERKFEVQAFEVWRERKWLN